MAKPAAGERKLTAEQMQTLAAATGVTLDEARAAALVAQAEPHFALMRGLDRMAHNEVEPAAEFRLDAWRRADNG